ncbi:HCLS1-associated protein X-1 [Labrus mixtus]|uniref:HCLS1-associated protein X-1 n=1 Tax=Labrus mixtus TaxID=508554 RepID=UPI0029C0EDAD|nr:HCLS1-associated protein X-1 [Labrus mixtus]
MSVFDLFRGFFGVPGGHYRGRRDPFFDTMTHDEDEDDEEEDGFYSDGFRGDQQDPFDGDWRFGFSFGPDGMRIQEPPVFGHVLREMEEIFSQLGRMDGQSESRHFGVPMLPPPQDGDKRGEGGSSGNPLRDFMLKSPDSNTQGPRPGPPREPRNDSHPSYESPELPGWTPFAKFNDFWKQGPRKAPDERKQDGDLDSAVSSGGLDQILTPPAGQTPNQPRSRSFFQSVMVTKVLKPDGSVEERRTVRDGHGNEETTVTRSGGVGTQEDADHHTVPLTPGVQHPFSDLRDDDSLFSKFFRGFK